MKNNLSRRSFLGVSGVVTAGALVTNPVNTFATIASGKKRLALVGTGVRGTSFWGKNIVDRYSGQIEFVGLCDLNQGRLEYAKEYMGVNCPVFTDFDEMVAKTKPDTVIVTTMDSTHHIYIIRALELGCDVITEKPLTTDEDKCRQILNAEKKAGKSVIVGFNYRWGIQFTRLKELLAEKKVGKITSVDFHWYLNTYHGADYFRRWHGERDKGGTLWVHKATHHFDLLNWWIDSDPVEVTAYGSLEHYGSNNKFRGLNCRNCAYTDQCKFFWDITKDKRSMELYANNEKYDGYIRDNCLWRNAINIYDKMSAQIKYANNVVVNYSLTTYSPYEGWQIAFNGMGGRIDSWEGIPWRAKERVNQSQLHTQEMGQAAKVSEDDYDEIMITPLWGEYELVKVPRVKAGHGGGDVRLQDKIFKDPNMADPYRHAAGTRDGALSIMIGIAARKSIEEKRTVKISELTDLPLLAVRP